MNRGIRNTIAFTPVSTRMITSQDAGTGLFSMDLKVPPCTLAIDRITFLDALKDARLCCRILQARVEGNLLHLASTEVEDGYNTAIPLTFAGNVLEGNFDLGTFSTRDLAQVATALRAFKQPTITLRAGSRTLLTFCVEMKGLALEFSLAPHISRPGDDLADEEEVEHDDGDGTEPDHEYQREDAAPPAADTTTDEAATNTPKEA
ncbi:MAG: hypothetical protein GYA24_05205 [Candidatus Lokiarchaeota archaeon]|nr:hypothetical protein [Candidatus Lokiarchaeota archaeon]